jgi:hypothetical protein
VSDRRSIVVWLDVVAHDVSLLHCTVKSGYALCKVNCQHIDRSYNGCASSYVPKGAV